MDPTEFDEEGTGGLDRRSVLRRGAVLGGALVWTVPAVQTLAGPAFAAGSPCVGQYQYTDTTGTCVRVTYLADNDCCSCITTTAAGLPGGAGNPVNILLAGVLCQSPAGSCKLDVANSGTC